MSEHPWERACPRWYAWSMDVREDWKAWLGFGIPMLLLTWVVLMATLLGLAQLACLAVEAIT